MLSKKVFKIRDTATGLYWTGKVGYPRGNAQSTFAMNATGKTWTTRRGLENTLQWTTAPRYQSTTTMDIPTTWVVEECDVIVKPIGETSLGDFGRHLKIRAELNKISSKYGYFYQEMMNRNVADKIAFVIQVKPATGNHYVTQTEILEARAQLRLLGVKTRTYREANGMFGLMDRSQALKARLSMDSSGFVDLEEIRNRI